MGFKRKSLSRKKSAKLFKRGAKRVHKKNVMSRPMRGGIRM